MEEPSAYGSKMYYGLTLLIDLENCFYKNQPECSLKRISATHNFSLCELETIAHTLEQVGVIGRQVENPDSVFLREKPQESHWIFKMLSILKKTFGRELLDC